MANLYLGNPLTYNEQITKVDVTIKDVDESINLLWDKVLHDEHIFPTSTFRYGSPMKWPSGKYGFVITGMHRGYFNRPTPKPLDFRVSQRTASLPQYVVTLGEVERKRQVQTRYYDEWQFKLEKPEQYWVRILRALSETYPLYLAYLYIKIWVPTAGFDLTKYPLLNEYITKYQEESNGSSEGYSAYGNKGLNAINYSDMKDGDQQKVTANPMKDRLEKINKLLFKDDAKITVTLAQSDILKHQKAKNDLSNEQNRKFVALCERIKQFICEVQKGMSIDIKYRVYTDENNKKFEGVNPSVKLSDLILKISLDDMCAWETEQSFQVAGDSKFTPGSSYFGVTVEVCPFLPRGNAMLFHKDLVQVYFLPEYNKNFIDKYPSEGTEDYITEFAHTLDIVDVYHRVWFVAQ